MGMWSSQRVGESLGAAQCVRGLQQSHIRQAAFDGPHGKPELHWGSNGQLLGRYDCCTLLSPD